MKNKRIFGAIVAGFVFLFAYQLQGILKIFGLRDFFGSAGFSVITNLLQILVCMAGLIFVYRVGPGKALKELGLRAPLGRAAAFSSLATLPILIGFAFTSSISPKLLLLNLAAFAIISPFAEEVVFRGYIFRQLYRRTGVGFWSAVLLPSILFGLGHMSQSKGVWDFVGITAITGLGSVFFAWTFMRWQDNLWVPFGLHFLMNFWWMVFAVDETALGGWLANAVRIMTVVIAVALTLNKDKIWKPLPAEEANILPPKKETENSDEIEKRSVFA
ncbi:MAG: CPBP family intramembrane metalloprotease [Pyrinomonadaceae bacterium]|nr:CPBP family intramembrane metalloprotease [Pyrinomonadaceae bacterium]